MTTQELQLGNIVDFLDLFEEVIALRRFEVELLSGNSVDITKLKPVILTEEILTKLGFTKDSKGEFIFRIDKHNYIELIQRNDPEYFCLCVVSAIPDENEHRTALDISMQYLHTLQNWIYLITHGDIELTGLNINGRNKS